MNGGTESVLRTRLSKIYSPEGVEIWIAQWRAADQVERRGMERGLTIMENDAF